MKADRTIKRTRARNGRHNESSAPVTIRGIIIPVDWDQSGNVMALAVSTHDEDEYLINKDDKGEQLTAFIRKSVEIRGHVTESQNRKTIRVEKYELKPVSGIGEKEMFD